MPMQPAAITGRDIVYRTQSQQGWREAIAGYQRAVEVTQRCLSEMKKPNSKWGYHYDGCKFKEFPSGVLEQGYKNVLLSCQQASTIRSEEALITAQVAPRIFNAFIQKLKLCGVVKNEDEQEAIRKFLHKKARDIKLRKILEFYPQSLMKCFHKIKASTFKCLADKQRYLYLKDDTDSQLEELAGSVDAISEVFMEQLKDKRRFDLVLLSQEVAEAKRRITHVQKLLSWVEVATLPFDSPADEKQVVMQLILCPKRYPGMVDLLNKLFDRKRFDNYPELKKFFAAWGLLLQLASPTFNRMQTIYENYYASQKALDQSTGCVSLEMIRHYPITLELCNAFLCLGGKDPLEELPKRIC